MGRWHRAWTLGVCLALVGCGSSPPASIPETIDLGERNSPPLNDDAGTGDAGTGDAGTPDAGGSTPGTGTPSPLDSPPTLAPRACLPWTAPVPPVRATACASDSVFADGTTQHARYDADSHPLEVRFHDASGALERVETHQWQDGLEVLSRTDYPSGAFSQTQWVYGSGSRLLQRINTGSNASTQDFLYDAQGRLTQVIGRYPSITLTSDYHYDAQGHLVSITNEDICGSDANRCATLTYWANGRLKRHAWIVGRFDNFVEEFDEAGRLVLSTVERSDSGQRTTRSYDAAGRPVRVEEASSSWTSEQQTLTTTFYDADGLRERFARDRTSRGDCDGTSCAPDSLMRQRLTRRTTFLCDTAIPALDEWDSDEDGQVDAQRTHERDPATGRLVHEAYSGTPGLDDGPVSRDFRYVCP